MKYTLKEIVFAIVSASWFLSSVVNFKFVTFSSQERILEFNVVAELTLTTSEPSTYTESTSANKLSVRSVSSPKHEYGTLFVEAFLGASFHSDWFS